MANPLLERLKPGLKKERAPTQAYAIGRSGLDGYGLFATRPLPQGSVVLQEASLLALTAYPDLRTALENQGSLLVKRTQELGTAEFGRLRLQVQRVHGSKIANFTKERLQDQDEKAVSMLLDTFGEFSLGNCGPEGGNLHRLFEDATKLNHACQPNAERSWSEMEKRIVVRAIRDIAIDDEIFISYIPCPYVPKDVRHQQLQFACRCGVCLRPLGMEERDQFYLNLGNALYAIASFRKGLLEPDEDVDFYDGSFTTLNVLKALSGYSEEHRSNVWDAAEWLTECVETEQLMHSSLAGLYEIAHTIIMGWDVGPPKAVKNWEETPVWNFEQEETARLHEAVGRNGKSPRDKSEALLDEETNQMAKQLYPANAEVASDQIRYKGQQREHHAPAKYGKEELKYLWRKHPRMRNDDLRLHPYYTRSSGQQHDAVQSENDVPDWQLITGQSVNTGGFLSLMSTDEQEEVAQRFSLRPPPSQLQQWPSPSHNALPGEANSEFAPHARSPAILDGALLASQPNATKSMHATIAEIAGATRDAMEIDPPRRMSASSADVGRMTMSGIGGQESETSSAGEGKGRLREDATLSGDFGSELFAAKPLVGETPVIDEARARDARAQLEEWVDRNSAIWQGKQKHPLEKETEAQPKVARDTNTQREDSGAQLSEKAKGKQRAVWVTPTDDSPAQDSNGDARQTGKSHKDSTAAHTDGTTSKPDVGEFERDEFIAFGAKLNQLRVCIICLGRSHLKTRFVLDQAWNMARYDEDAEKILVSMLTELRVGVRIERYGSAKEERYLKQTVDLQPFAANREMKDVGKGKRKAQPGHNHSPAPPWTIRRSSRTPDPLASTPPSAPWMHVVRPFQQLSTTRKHAVRSCERYGAKQVGVFATRNIKEGEVILSDRPILSVNSFVTAEHARKLLTFFPVLVRRLSSAERKRFNFLCFRFKGSPIKDFDSKLDRPSADFKNLLLSTFLAFCEPFALHEHAEVLTLCLEICMLNHSCRPNAELHWSEDDDAMILRATRAMDKDDEILVSYLETPIMSPGERQVNLGFSCMCEICWNLNGKWDHHKHFETLYNIARVAKTMKDHMVAWLPEDMGSLTQEQRSKLVTGLFPLDMLGDLMTNAAGYTVGTEVVHSSTADIYNLVFIHAMARALMYTAEREAMLDVAQRAKDIEMDMLGTCLGEDHERYKQVEEQLSWVEGHMSGLYEGLEELPYFAVD